MKRSLVLRVFEEPFKAPPYNGGINWFVVETMPAPGIAVRNGLGLVSDGETALVFGGGNNDNSNGYNNSNSFYFNGLIWSIDTATLPFRIKEMGTSGTPDAALSVAGEAYWEYEPGEIGWEQSPFTMEYNGSSWSSGGNLPRNMVYNPATGTQNATLTNGFVSFPSNDGFTAEYNGSSWSTKANSSYRHTNGTMVGNPDAAKVIGGGSNTTLVEDFDGSVWSTQANATIRIGLDIGWGDQDDAYFSAPLTNKLTYHWDGISYSVNGRMNYADHNKAKGSSNGTGIAISPFRNYAEKFIEGSYP